MGLSDGERYNGIICAIHRMSQIHFEKSWTDNPTKLNKLIDKLWPAFRGCTSNNNHWIIGSDSDSSYFPEVSFLGSAFSLARAKMLANKDAPPFPFSSLPDDATDEQKEAQEKRVDSYEFFSEYKPTAISLLEKEGKNEANIYKLLKDTESYFYFTNRYRDKFSRKLKNVTEIVAKIQGILWDEFSEHPVYFKAWMADQILDKVILDFCDNDIVADWFKHDCLHHHISMREVSDRYVYDTFKKIQARPNVTLPAHRRVVIMLRFLGKDFYYEHQHKALIKMISTWNEKYPNNQVKIDIIKKMCKDAKEAHDADLKERDYSEYCNVTEQEINTKSGPMIEDDEE